MMSKMSDIWSVLVEIPPCENLIHTNPYLTENDKVGENEQILGMGWVKVTLIEFFQQLITDITATKTVRSSAERWCHTHLRRFNVGAITWSTSFRFSSSPTSDSWPSQILKRLFWVTLTSLSTVYERRWLIEYKKWGWITFWWRR